MFSMNLAGIIYDILIPGKIYTNIKTVPGIDMASRNHENSNDVRWITAELEIISRRI